MLLAAVTDGPIAIDIAASFDSSVSTRDLWFEQFDCPHVDLNRRTPTGGGFPTRRRVAQSGAPVEDGWSDPASKLIHCTKIPCQPPCDEAGCQNCLWMTATCR